METWKLDADGNLARTRQTKTPEIEEEQMDPEQRTLLRNLTANEFAYATISVGNALRSLLLAQYGLRRHLSSGTYWYFKLDSSQKWQHPM